MFTSLAIVQIPVVEMLIKNFWNSVFAFWTFLIKWNVLSVIDIVWIQFFLNQFYNEWMWQIFDFTYWIVIGVLNWKIRVFIKNTNQLLNSFLLSLSDIQIVKIITLFPDHINLVICIWWFVVTPRWISAAIFNVWFAKEMLVCSSNLNPILSWSKISDSNPNIILHHWYIISIFSLAEIFLSPVLNICFVG